MNGGFSNPITGLNGVLIRKQIQSQNFQQGVSGWIIRQDGTAEFNGATFRGTVIIQSNQAILFYSGIPAHGNLVGSISPIAGTDAFTNNYPKGYFWTDGTVGAIITSFNTFLGIDGATLELLSGSPNENLAYQVYTQLVPSGAEQIIVGTIRGPSVTVMKDSVAISFLSSSDAGISFPGAFAEFVYTQVIGTVSSNFTMADYDFGGFTIEAGTVRATKPGTGTDRTNPALGEAWNNAALGANFAPLGGVFGTPRYQKEGINGGRVRLSGAVTLLAAQAQGTAMFNMPVGYRPLTEKRFITANSLNGGAGSQTESVNVATNGNVSIGHSGVNGNYVFLDDITFELD